jgi:hypothetical protein
MTNVIAWALAMMFVAVPGLAHSPEDTDPAMAPWFNSLMNPSNGGSCCNERDCATVSTRDLKIENGSYWVRDPDPTNVVWLMVPTGQILKRYDNPTGKPVACIANHHVACFIMAAGI